MDNLITLSFDDGYVDYVKVAKLLSNLGVKATFYLTTHIREWGKRQLLATRPDLIIEISDLGHEIGCLAFSRVVLRSFWNPQG